MNALSPEQIVENIRAMRRQLIELLACPQCMERLLSEEVYLNVCGCMNARTSQRLLNALVCIDELLRPPNSAELELICETLDTARAAAAEHIGKSIDTMIRQKPEEN